jgi:hypothetical protein
MSSDPDHSPFLLLRREEGKDGGRMGRLRRLMPVEGALSQRHDERSEGERTRLRRLMPVEGTLSPNNCP